MNKMALHFICDISSALQLRTTPQQLGGEKLPPTSNCGAKEKMIRRLRKEKAESSESAAKRCANYIVSNRESRAITLQGYQSKASSNMIGLKLTKYA